MTKSTLSPFVVSNANEVELTDAKGVKKTYWRKEILPGGTRKYKGQTLDFTKINPSCVKAFESGSVGDVPFVFALSDNSHPKPGKEEEENLGGDLHKLELGEGGSLFGYFDLSERALEAVKNSKGKFGVSGRIEPDYVASDTEAKFDYALTHVCGTTRPHVKNLAAWEAVELSDAEKADGVVDLSTEVEEVKTDVVEGGKVNVEIDKDTLDALLELAKDHKDTKAALAAMDSKDGKDDKVVATLSEEDKSRRDALELSTKNALELAEKAHIELAETRWTAKRAELARAGVPPVILSKVEPLMKLHRRSTIDLSDGTKVDPFAVVEDILEACKGVVDLSDEGGHGITAGAPSIDKEFDDFYNSLVGDMGYDVPTRDSK